MKLGVLVLAGPENGGTYQYTLSMLQALRHVRGIDVTLYGDPQNPEFVALGYPMVGFTESRAGQLTALLADQLRIKLTDPFVAQDVLLAPIYSLALLHTAVPFAFTLHDLQENYYPENFTSAQLVWRHQVNSRLLKKARRVICESNQVKSDIAGSFGVAAQHIVVMPAPPQQQFFALQSSDEQPRAVRSRLQLPEQYLFYPAQFWVHKNHVRLIEAFRQVADQHPELKLVLTGKKRDEYQSVMNAIARLGLRDQVHHLGYVAQNDLQAIYRLATALVMPSLFESISIPVYEAFQAGTPVAASGILAIPEQVGDAAVLFDPLSIDSIKQAMLKIIDPDVGRELAKRGRQRMSAMTLERYGAQLQDLLGQLA